MNKRYLDELKKAADVARDYRAAGAASEFDQNTQIVIESLIEGVEAVRDYLFEKKDRKEYTSAVPGQVVWVGIRRHSDGDEFAVFDHDPTDEEMFECFSDCEDAEEFESEGPIAIIGRKPREGWHIPHMGGCHGHNAEGRCENPQCTYTGGDPG